MTIDSPRRRFHRVRATGYTYILRRFALIGCIRIAYMYHACSSPHQSAPVKPCLKHTTAMPHIRGTCARRWHASRMQSIGRRMQSRMQSIGRTDASRMQSIGRHMQSRMQFIGRTDQKSATRLPGPSNLPAILPSPGSMKLRDGRHCLGP